MIRFKQSVLDAVYVAKHVEHVDTPPGVGTDAVLRKIGDRIPLSVRMVWFL